MKPPQRNQIICGNNLDVVKSWPPNCIDSIVTDPPYGLEFMGKDWDKLGAIALTDPSVVGGFQDGKGGNPFSRSRIRFGENVSSAQEWHYQWAKAMLRITKPGGFLLCFGGTRTYHRLTCAIEDAGWEIRDCMMWLYGSGFPKSHDISKAIDKKAGAKRKVVGTKHGLPGYSLTNGLPGGVAMEGNVDGSLRNGLMECNITAPTTDLAQLWNGYGTALKPAWEPIIVAMKPLDGTFAHNAEKHGVAGLNIDGGRIGTDTITQHGRKESQSQSMSGKNYEQKSGTNEHQGRWPANLILDEEAGAMLDEQTGTKKSGFMVAGTKRQMSDNPNKNTYGKFNPDTVRNDTYGDRGGASRFFYCAKTSRKERNMGMEDSFGKKVNDGRQTPIDNPYQRGETIRKNTHPTVKPLALMKYLCTLLKMPSAEQIILDPFLGSGTTGMACRELGINFVGIEKETEYCEIAVRRIAAVEGIHPVVLHTETPPAEAPKTIPDHDEHRQSIINAASAELRRNRK